MTADAPTAPATNSDDRALLAAYAGRGDHDDSAHHAGSQRSKAAKKQREYKGRECHDTWDDPDASSASC